MSHEMSLIIGGFAAFVIVVLLFSLITFLLNKPNPIVWIIRLIMYNRELKLSQKLAEQKLIQDLNLNRKDYEQFFNWIRKNIPKEDCNDNCMRRHSVQYLVKLNMLFLHVLNVLFGNICTLRKYKTFNNKVNGENIFLAFGDVSVTNIIETNWLIMSKDNVGLFDNITNTKVISVQESIAFIIENKQQIIPWLPIKDLRKIVHYTK